MDNKEECKCGGSGRIQVKDGVYGNIVGWTSCPACTNVGLTTLSDTGESFEQANQKDVELFNLEEKLDIPHKDRMYNSSDFGKKMVQTELIGFLKDIINNLTPEEIAKVLEDRCKHCYEDTSERHCYCWNDE